MRKSVFASAHSCGLRLESGAVRDIQQALPQRIRAGCDELRKALDELEKLCLSAFVRVATQRLVGDGSGKILFASAHSCGLRLEVSEATLALAPLPQRIRAGCDLTTMQAQTHRS